MAVFYSATITLCDRFCGPILHCVLHTALKNRPTNKTDLRYSTDFQSVLEQGSDGEIIAIRQQASDFADEQADVAEAFPKLWTAMKADIHGLIDDEGNLTIIMISQAGYTLETAHRFQNSI